MERNKNDRDLRKLTAKVKDSDAELGRLRDTNDTLRTENNERITQIEVEKSKIAAT
jgi:hypothetical protein